MVSSVTCAPSVSAPVIVVSLKSGYVEEPYGAACNPCTSFDWVLCAIVSASLAAESVMVVGSSTGVMVVLVVAVVVVSSVAPGVVTVANASCGCIRTDRGRPWGGSK